MPGPGLRGSGDWARQSFQKVVMKSAQGQGFGELEVTVSAEHPF